MPLLLITYQVFSQDDDHENDLVEAIEYYPNTKLTETSYVIETKDQPQVIFEELRRFLDRRDTLLIFRIKSPWYGHGHMDMIDWVSKKI